MAIKNKLTQSKQWINKYYSNGTNQRKEIGRFNAPKRGKAGRQSEKNAHCETYDWKKMKKTTIGLDAIFSQSNKVWSCESHNVSACGESRKKYYFIFVFFLCVRKLLWLLFVWRIDRLLVKWIGLSYARTRTHLYAIKLSITSVNIDIILCLLVDERKMTWFWCSVVAFALAFAIPPNFHNHIFCVQSVCQLIAYCTWCSWQKQLALFQSQSRT